MSVELQFKGRRFRVTALADGTWRRESINRPIEE
jgi:hypothetical protein